MREALASEGLSGRLPGLHVSVIRRRKVVRLAFAGPQAPSAGASWYVAHEVLPQRLSRAANATVHAYLYEPSSKEEVIAYGNGRRVGGDRVVYDEVDLPVPMEEMDDAAFAHMRSRWPLGHLAYVFGLKREELLGLPRASASAVLALDASDVEAQLEALLPSPQVPVLTFDAA
ncbi:hypothetical protein [Stigmatella aurantiaca]|uniref:hypothetical protein n=1 Tax=Stigmatella aurantiaca TaxID=41 RepID=UPI0002FE48DF|nr:hypothetical protein [Stigmatella aurantiaca]